MERATSKISAEAIRGKDWLARWIWSEGEPQPRNAYLYARRSFQVPADLGEALTRGLSLAWLRISADSRYVLYLNGVRIGQGPARSWPFDQQYDVYDVGRHLRPGENVVAVLVQHYGEETFQYVLGRAGLLLQVDAGVRPGNADPAAGGSAGMLTLVATDRTWKVQMASAYDRRTPRISCQQAWVEHFDSRLEPRGWTAPGFDDAGWADAVEIGPVGTTPWTSMSPRTIPFLTEEPVYPARLVRARTVRSPHTIWSFDLRPSLLPGDRSANPSVLHGLVTAAWVNRAGVELDVELRRFWGVGRRLRVNGEEVTFADDVARVRLHPGANLFVLDVSGWNHSFFCTFGFKVVSGPGPSPGTGDEAITGFEPLAAGEGSPWTVLGPCPEERPEFQRLWEARDVETARQVLGAVQGREAGTEQSPEPAGEAVPLSRVAREHVVSDHVWARTVAQEEVPEVGPRVLEPEGFLHAGQNCTVVEPTGHDVELWLDFGREIAGFVEFDLDAPAGTILDWNFFEGVQEGRILFTDGLNNALRYICSEGHQFYHSIVRRGFRYALLTLRNFHRPVRLYTVRCLLNTYPFAQRGEFTCSDSRLNEIWKMGAWTTRLCSEDTFVDCPAYEQTFWVGDSRNEALVAQVAFGDSRLADRCLRLVAQSLARSPLPESQVPSGWRNVLPAWSLLWMLACHEHYQFTGDIDFLSAIYPALAITGRNFEKYLNQDGLFEIEAWNMLDWAPMDTPGAGVVTHQNGWLVEAWRRTAELAEALAERWEEQRQPQGCRDTFRTAIPGVPPYPADPPYPTGRPLTRDLLLADAGHFRELAARLKEAINRHLWSEEHQAFIDSIHADGTRSSTISQQTNTVMYLCDVAWPDRRPLLERYLKEPPEGWVRVGSPFMMFFTFEALARSGDFEAILDLTREHWGFMLDHGATTCWEVFPAPTGDRWTRSWCHAWSAGPTYFLSAYQLGVRPLAAGCREVLVAPEPAGLRWAKGRVPTPRGEVEVSWEWETETEWRLHVSLPAGVQAKVVLPQGLLPDPAAPAALALPARDGWRQEGGRWVTMLPGGDDRALRTVKARKARLGGAPE